MISRSHNRKWRLMPTAFASPILFTTGPITPPCTMETIIPTTANDEYFAELALWFGVSGGDLPAVLPNVGRFFTPVTGGRPLGFMS